MLDSRTPFGHIGSARRGQWPRDTVVRQGSTATSTTTLSNLRDPRAPGEQLTRGCSLRRQLLAAGVVAGRLVLDLAARVVTGRLVFDLPGGGGAGGLGFDDDAAHQGEGEDVDPRGSRRARADARMINSAHDGDSQDVQFGAFRHQDLDAAHQREDAYRHLAIGEAGLAQVELSATHQRERGEVTADYPVAGSAEPAHDRDSEA